MTDAASVPEKSLKEQIATASGPELAALYNEMVLTAIDLGLDGYKTVARFEAPEVGRRRCAALHSTLEARRASNAAYERQEAGGKVKDDEEPTAPFSEDNEMGTKTVKKATKKAPRAKKEAATKAPRAAKANGAGAHYRGAVQPAAALKVIVKENPRTTPKTQERFEFMRNCGTVGAYCKKYTEDLGVRDIERARREGWVKVG